MSRSFSIPQLTPWMYGDTTSHMNVSQGPLSSRAVRILQALIRNLVPPTEALDYTSLELEAVRAMARLVREFPKFFRWGFMATLVLFEYLPFVFGFGTSRFSHLPPERQFQYMDGWAKSRLSLRREIFVSLRGVVLLAYCSNKRVWEYIGYQPEGHMRERIQLREEILRRQAT